VFQGADPRLPDDERGCAGRSSVQPRCGADPARLLGGRAGRPCVYRRGGDAEPRGERPGAGHRTALALLGDLSAPDAGRAGPGYRSTGAGTEPAGALGAGAEPGSALAQGAAVSAPAARAEDLE